MSLNEEWDIGALHAEAGRLVNQTMERLADLDRAAINAESGNGSVVATVNGFGVLQEIRVSPAACRHSDAERLADLLLTAVRDAERAATQARGELFERLTFAGQPIARLIRQAASLASTSNVASVSRK